MPPASQQYLESFVNHEIHLGQMTSDAFKIERVVQLLQRLGSPQKDLKIIHVAGSKGKGSTCALTASILKEAGYKVGLYTSPHINHYRERIRILSSKACLENLCHPEAKPKDLGRRDSSSRLSPLLRMTGGSKSQDIFPDCISEEDLCDVIDEARPAIEEARAKGELSFFEVYTALALCYFQRTKVDFVVLEVGLGGRLDATNAADSVVAAVAPISLEHTRILGDTLAQIAEEKAAIIKNSKQKVVIAPQEEEAQDVLERRCQMFDINPVRVSKHVKHQGVQQNPENQSFDLKTGKVNYGRLTMPLLGAHQRDNAAVSISIVECLQDLGFIVPGKAIQDGCANVFWPGRLEAIAKDPLILIDGAHNPDSARALAQTIQDVFAGKKVILILGASEDKNIKFIHGELSGITKSVIFTKADHPRAANLAGAVGVKEALELARKTAGPEDIILVTGSIFVISEARKLLIGDGFETVPS